MTLKKGLPTTSRNFFNMTTLTTQKWNKVLLKDAVTFKTGKLNSNAATKNGKYPFFTCSQEIFKTDTYSFDTECVLLGGNNANAVYPIFYFKGKFDAYQRTYVIESSKNNVRYLYYLLKEKLNELRLKSTGSATKFLTLKILNQIQIRLPEYDVQKQIVDVLSAYDDLLEANARRIQILKKIAKTFYKEWFINFRFPNHENVKMVDGGNGVGEIPEEWELKNLTDTGLFTLRKDRIKSFTGEKMYLDTSSIEGIGIAKEPLRVTSDTAPSRAQFQPSKNSVWFARMSNTYKVLVFSDDSDFEVSNYILSSGMLGLETERKYLAFLFFTINSESFHQLKDQNATGSTQVSLTNGGFEKIRNIIPPKEIIEKYSNLINPLVDEILNLQKENQILKNTRELLIPKFVLGEIKV